MSDKLLCGFAVLPEDQHRTVSASGGKASQAVNQCPHFTPSNAAEMGSKGGKKVSENRKHMAEIGRKGGQAKKKAG